MSKLEKDPGKLELYLKVQEILGIGQFSRVPSSAPNVKRPLQGGFVRALNLKYKTLSRR